MVVVVILHDRGGFRGARHTGDARSDLLALRACRRLAAASYAAPYAALPRTRENVVDHVSGRILRAWVPRNGRGYGPWYARCRRRSRRLIIDGVHAVELRARLRKSGSLPGLREILLGEALRRKAGLRESRLVEAGLSNTGLRGARLRKAWLRETWLCREIRVVGSGRARCRRADETISASDKRGTAAYKR